MAVLAMIGTTGAGLLRAGVDGTSRLSLEPSTGATLGGVLNQVAARWPRPERRLRDERGELRRYVNVYVDREDCRRMAELATPVPDGGRSTCRLRWQGVEVAGS